MARPMEFSDIGRHPLLRPESIDGVLTYFPHAVNRYPLARFMPLVNVNADKVEMDITKQRAGGMTPLVATGSESPIYGGSARGTIEWEAAEFREKVILTEKDLVLLRKIGTKGELDDARRVMSRKFKVIEQRLTNRIEWMRRQVLFDGAVTATTADGVDLTVPYTHPDYLEVTLTGTDRWDQVSTADPVGDLQEWVEDYMVDTGFGVAEIMLPMFMYRHLIANDKFVSIQANSHAGFRGDNAAVRELLADMAGVPSGIIVQELGRIHQDTELTADAAALDTSLFLLDTDELEAGDTVYVKRSLDRDAEKRDILTVNHATGEVTFTTGLDKAYQAGDPVTYWKPIIPLDKVLMVGSVEGAVSSVGAEGEPDRDLLEGWGDVASTLSRYEDLNNPKPGLFTKTIDKLDEDPPRLEQVLGIKALPRINYAEGWFHATVL